MIKNSILALLLPVLLAPAAAQTPAQNAELEVIANALCAAPGQQLPSDPGIAAATLAIEAAGILFPELYVDRSAGCLVGGTPVQQLCVSYYSAVTGKAAGLTPGFDILTSDQIASACGMPMDQCANKVCVDAVENLRGTVKTNCTAWNQCK